MLSSSRKFKAYPKTGVRASLGHVVIYWYLSLKDSMQARVPPGTTRISQGERTDKIFGNLSNCSLSNVINSVPNRNATAA